LAKASLKSAEMKKGLTLADQAFSAIYGVPTGSSAYMVEEDDLLHDIVCEVVIEFEDTV
jgi:hypothetical protein